MYHPSGITYFHRLGKETRYGSKYHEGSQRKTEGGNTCKLCGNSLGYTFVTV